MSNKGSFEHSKETFSAILGNSNFYLVPKYQRDYSWGEEQWDELWQDILFIHEQEPQDREDHYMGYLVLQRQAKRNGKIFFTIIDGQQRLTTLSLLVLSVLQILQASNDEQNAERIDLIRNNYISTKGLGSLIREYKLELNRNNDEYYRNELASLETRPRKRNIKRTEHQMRKAKEFYEKEIRQLDLSGSELGDFIGDIIGNYLIFTVIEVSDDINAYKVFETLNARGIQLSTPDLLKNHLFSIIDPRYENSRAIELQEEQWSATLNNLGKQDFSKFLRCFWNSRNSQASKSNLFKKIKTTCTSEESAIALLSALKGASSVYAALQDYKDELWQAIASDKHRRQIQQCLLALDIFNMAQPYPVLLSAYFAYAEADFAKLCHWLHTFCLRYQAICNLPSNDVEKFYNRIAIAINEQQPISEIKKQLVSRLPSDEAFRQSFASKTLSMSQSQKKAHYLLASIENHLNPSNPTALTGSYTIEHILPKSNYLADDTYWRDQFGDLLEQNVSRLGNLALLTEKAKANRDADTLSFAEKKAIYSSSNLKLLHKLCQYEDWNPDSLIDYQAYMAQQAVEIWAIA